LSWKPNQSLQTAIARKVGRKPSVFTRASESDYTEQAFLFEILLNKYSYETQNVMSIINSAINGKICIYTLVCVLTTGKLHGIEKNLNEHTGGNNIAIRN